MSKQRENKKKHNCSCCSCFGNSTHEGSSAYIDSSNTNEPYDFVVEKLAIKRVPLSLFATQEDFEKHSGTMSSSISSIVSKKSVKIEQPPSSPKEKPMNPALPVKEKPEQPNSRIKEKPSVTFSEYYNMSAKTDLNNITPFSDIHRDASITSLVYEPQQEVKLVNANFIQSRKKPLTEEQEKELVSQILNKHSSIFTLDAKNPIPKDPDHLPRNTAVVPQSVHATLRNKQQFPPTQDNNRHKIKVEVHRASGPEMAFPIASTKPATSGKKDMTPELKETINALGFAQKPHTPGFPPKNQRNINSFDNASDSSNDKQMSYNLSGGDDVTENAPSLEIACLRLDSKEKYSKCDRTSTSLGLGAESENGNFQHDRFLFNSERYSSSNVSPLFTPTKKHRKYVTVQQVRTPQSDKSVLAIPGRSSNNINIASILNETTHTSAPKIRNVQQTSDHGSHKGPSLKWKIIIKHHSDKKKVDCGIASQSDDSESDVEGKYYSPASTINSSPHQ